MQITGTAGWVCPGGSKQLLRHRSPALAMLCSSPVLTGAGPVWAQLDEESCAGPSSAVSSSGGQRGFPAGQETLAEPSAGSWLCLAARKPRGRCRVCLRAAMRRTGSAFLPALNGGLPYREGPRQQDGACSLPPISAEQEAPVHAAGVQEVACRALAAGRPIGWQGHFTGALVLCRPRIIRARGGQFVHGSPCLGRGTREPEQAVPGLCKPSSRCRGRKQHPGLWSGSFFPLCT